MRILKISLWCAVFAGVVVLHGCAGLDITASSEEGPQRIYKDIGKREVMAIIQKMLEGEGFNIAEKSRATGFMRTEWMTYSGDTRYADDPEEKRMLEIVLVTDKKENTVSVTLRLFMQDKKPIFDDWRHRMIQGGTDTQCRRILDRIDNAVMKKGGTCIARQSP